MYILGFDQNSNTDSLQKSFSEYNLELPLSSFKQNMNSIERVSMNSPSKHVIEECIPLRHLKMFIESRKVSVISFLSFV
jgi:hypothetical protein